MPKVVNLFEFGKYSWKNSEEFRNIREKEKFSDDLEDVLDNIWKDRKKFIFSENLYYESISLKQRYIEFNKNEIIPRNWIGSIYFRSGKDEYVLNLLPKIFYQENHSYKPEEIDSIFAHILWWLSGSEKQSFSSMESSLGAMNSDFLEVLLYIFSSYTLEIFSANAYHYYSIINEDLDTVRGQLNFSAYIKNFAVGNKHKLNCTFDSLQYDNQFNKIVKYVCHLLKDFTKNEHTRKNLEEILFILDEVEYEIMSVGDCDKVILNSIYTEFRTILDNCRLFLSSLSVYKWKDDYQIFALLIPSEKLFENFIFSIIKNYAVSPVINVDRHRKGKRLFLATQSPSPVPNRFKMINDIVVTFNDNSLILFDTKYKKIHNTNSLAGNDTYPEYNISQSDIYQMISYAVGSGISDIGLIFPAFAEDDISDSLPIYEIKDEFSPATIIRIHIFKVNIFHNENLRMSVNGKLEEMFKKTKKHLILQLNEAISKVKSL
ncbi:MAG: hypothetical protein WCK67_08545 [bacterium]